MLVIDTRYAYRELRLLLITYGIAVCLGCISVMIFLALLHRIHWRQL